MPDTKQERETFSIIQTVGTIKRLTKYSKREPRIPTAANQEEKGFILFQNTLQNFIIIIII